MEKVIASKDQDMDIKKEITEQEDLTAQEIESLLSKQEEDEIWLKDLATFNFMLGMLNDPKNNAIFVQQGKIADTYMAPICVGDCIIIQWLIKINKIKQDSSLSALIQLLKMNIKHEPIEIQNSKAIQKAVNDFLDHCTQLLQTEKKEQAALREEADKWQQFYEIRKLKHVIVAILANVELEQVDREMLDKYSHQDIEDKIFDYLNNVINANEKDVLLCLQKMENDYFNRYKAKMSSELIEQIAEIKNDSNMFQEEKSKWIPNKKRKVKIDFFETALNTLENCETIMVDIKNETDTDSLESICREIQKTHNILVKRAIGNIVKNIEKNLMNK